MAALMLAADAYRDKVLGGWTGKSAGVTLGAVLRGQVTPSVLNFYNPIPGQPAPSPALDFSVAWLAALEETGGNIDTDGLKRTWLEKLDYNHDEFGYAALNMRRGLPSPASGSHSNWFRHGTGAIMRADLWAMVAPGNPQAAAAFAYHDAVLDHSEEGVWAAMLLAAIGSAAFFISDPLPLITIGLAMIPRTCRTARAVKTALAAGQRGASWLEARESVQHEVEHKNFSDVPQNIGFLTIGLLYGRNDFGDSLCSAVNCGYDSEATGAALGALLGILRGAGAIPQDWMRPIGDILIPGNGARDVEGVLSLTALADRTVAVGRAVASAKCPEIEIVDALPTPNLSNTEPAYTPPPAPAPLEAAPLDFVEFHAPPVENQPVEEQTAAEPAEALEAQDAAYAPASAPAPQAPGIFAPQPVSEEAAPLVEPERDPASDAAVPTASLAPDPMSAVAWVDSTLVKPLLVTPTNAFIGLAGPFEVQIDTGDTPSIGYNQVKTLAVSIFNRGSAAFSGRVTLLAPPGWQVAPPASFGQRQYIAADTGSLRGEFRLQAADGQARIEIANALVVRMTPDGGGAPFETRFVLMGASCWWTVGTFANFDGEGFDRSYTPEDRPGLNESYVARNLQSVRWSKQTFPESVLDVEPLFKNSSGVCYGQTILRSPYPREARLTVSCNNGVKVWVNGLLALRRHQRTNFRPTLNDENWTADVSLRSGDNPVMVKWVRGTEPYQFSLTVSDRQGRALPDIGNTSW